MNGSGAASFNHSTSTQQGKVKRAAQHRIGTS
jgi:hypothetical protein